MSTTVKPKVNITKLYRRVLQLAREHPSRKAMSVYIGANNQPCCIIGTALVDLGVPKDALKASNSETICDISGNGRYGAIELTGGGGRFNRMLEHLQEVQERQDNGVPWGEAVKS